MSPGITRRDSLRYCAAFGLAFLVNPAKAVTGIMPIAGAGINDDFVVVETVPKHESDSLENLLEPPDEPLPSKDINIEVARWPEIAYHIGIARLPGTDILRLIPKYVGSTFLLNDNGFFVSAYHVFEDHIKKKSEGGTGTTMLVYDPQTGFALPSRPLIFSEKYDILLGKVELNGRFPIKKTYISRTDLPPSGYVYLTRYGNKDYIAKSLLREVIDIGMPELKRTGAGPRFTFRQERLLKNVLGRDLGGEVIVGQSVDFRYKEGEKAVEDWEYTFLSNLVGGDSGTQVFDLQNRLIGITTKTWPVIKGKDTGKEYTAGIYTGPFQIREMIMRYTRHNR